MGLVSVERDIQHELLSARMSRRNPGHVPYPFKYSPTMASFDIWDHMFLSSCCRSLTMHQFDKPPEKVLDLGCGMGYWAIEAAKQWPQSTIVGLDVAKIQPPLALLRDYKPIASRVQWINENFLDGLPFHENHFDFVRIVGIGLAVPEDEWQHLLEEVFRVMKPGAVIEIIEEDLLFPCATPPHRKSRFPSVNIPSSLELTVPSSSSLTLSSMSSGDEKSLRSPTGSFPAGSSLLSASTMNMYYDDYHEEEESGLQDHGRLKLAWETMLSSRFICSKLLSVLPFYIASSSFADVKSHSPCKIPLPQNSGASHQVKIQQMRMMHDDFLQRSTCTSPSRSARSSSIDERSVLDLGSRYQESSYSWSRMHLAKTVNTIKASKEAIWHEYARLYPKGRSASVRFINGSRAILSSTSCREAFETDWKNWENDMTDRIGMRDCLVSQLSWSEPAGERPDWRVWRGHLEKEYSSRDSGYASLSGEDPEDLCRSVAGFVGWKPN